MMRILGLDISSARTGVVVLDGDDRTFSRVVMTHIDLTKREGMWEKVDETRGFFQERAASEGFQGLDGIAVEEALLAFRPGLSSAQTITTLVRMNVLTCMLVRDILGLTPSFIPSSSARKVCGIRTQQVGKCGKPIKDQVFDHMLQHDLSDLKSVWPMKKQSKSSIEKGRAPRHQDWCYDVCDAYVIARAGMLLNI